MADDRELREQEEKDRQARRERRKEAQEAAKNELANRKVEQQAQADVKVTSKPTPTPVEIDLARLGLGLSEHEPDGSAEDTRALHAAPASDQAYSTRALTSRRGRQHEEPPKTE
jgi:hypothetical protein